MLAKAALQQAHVLLDGVEPLLLQAVADAQTGGNGSFALQHESRSTLLLVKACKGPFLQKHLTILRQVTCGKSGCELPWPWDARAHQHSDRRILRFVRLQET